MLASQKIGLNGVSRAMKIDFPGLLKERMPSGAYRYRVRVEGNPRKRIKMHVEPGHKLFLDHYHAARAGVEVTPETTPEERAVRGSVAWLTYRHLASLEAQVAAGQASAKTLKKRRNIFAQLRDRFGEFKIDIPQRAVVSIRDSMAHTPAAANAMVEAIRVMYRWAIEQELADVNPAVGVGKLSLHGSGARQWMPGDYETFKTRHPRGTTAFKCLTLLVFTACRIGDAAKLGRRNEFVRQGVRGLAWQPEKRGSIYTEIPMLPPLYEVTRESTVQGDAYLLTEYGRPFTSGDALGQRFRKWCDEAGLHHLSAHGVRKGAGKLMAELGCTQYQIMAVMSHTEAKTSETYTKGVDRWNLAVEAMDKMGSIEW